MQMTIVKTLIKKPFFFCNGFRGFLSYYVTNIFDIPKFDNETMALLKFLEISILFIYFFYLKEIMQPHF